MQPSDPNDPNGVPDILRKADPGYGPRPAQDEDNIDVGAFEQGSPFSRWALGRYLVGRALAEAVGNALLTTAVVLLVLAAVAKFLVHSTLLMVLLIIIALIVLLVRWVLMSLVRRLTGFAQFGPLEKRMSDLLGETESDVLRELRRIGLPGRVFTLPFLALRFLGRTRRADTLTRLKQFETERAVPKARLDEMHLILRQAAGAPPRQPPPPPPAR